MFHEMLAFEAYAYDFLIFESLGAFLLMESDLLLERGIANDNGIADKNRISFSIKVFGVDPEACSKLVNFDFGAN